MHQRRPAVVYKVGFKHCTHIYDVTYFTRIALLYTTFDQKARCAIHCQYRDLSNSLSTHRHLIEISWLAERVKVDASTTSLTANLFVFSRDALQLNMQTIPEKSEHHVFLEAHPR